MAKKKFEYKYVFSWFSKQPTCKEDFKIIGCTDANAVAQMACSMSKKDKFYVYTKAEAHKKGLIPGIICGK